MNNWSDSNAQRHAAETWAKKNQQVFNDLGNTIVEAINPSMNRLRESFQTIIKDTIETIQASPEYQALHEIIKRRLWQRYEGESIFEWGKRLDAYGLLDKPDIRWEYQKACLLWLVYPVRWCWQKIQSMRGDS